MQSKLSKSAASVQKVLDEHKLKSIVLELPSCTRTALEAATSIGCDLQQIVKSLVFRTKATCQPVLVLASGLNQVDLAKLTQQVGEDVVKADADFVRAVTGFAIGGIPPIGHKTEIDFVYIDESLLEFDEVWAAAGTPNAVFCIHSQDLLKAARGETYDIGK